MRTLKDAIEATGWKNTIHGESYARIASRWGNPELRKINQAWVDNLSSRIAKEHTPSTANRQLSLLGKLLKAGGVRQGITIKRLPTPETERRAFTDGELAAVDQWFRANTQGTVLACYAILRESGCRPGEEYSRITVQDMDFTRRLLTLHSKKGGTIDRTVPMTDQLADALAWSYHHGISQLGFRAAFNKMRDSLFPGDMSVVPYTLRHTYARRLLSNGIPVHVVSRMMGHTSLETTMQYVRVAPEDRDNVIKALSL